MADNETLASPQADEAPTTASTPAPAATNTPEPQAGEGKETTISLEEARKLRSEAANLRKRLKGYEDAEQAARDAQLSEVERSQKQLADLQAKYDAYSKTTQERIVRYEVERAAAKLNIIDPEAAATLLNRAELEFDDDGTPTNATKLLERLIKNKPYLAPPAQAPAPASPAQTAEPAKPAAPAIPAMNPGRATIQTPGTASPGRIPRLEDVFTRP